MCFSTKKLVIIWLVLIAQVYPYLIHKEPYRNIQISSSILKLQMYMTPNLVHICLWERHITQNAKWKYIRQFGIVNSCFLNKCSYFYCQVKMSIYLKRSVEIFRHLNWWYLLVKYCFKCPNSLTLSSEGLIPAWQRPGRDNIGPRWPEDGSRSGDLHINGGLHDGVAPW